MDTTNDTHSLLTRASRIGAMIVIAAEKLGHEGLAEIEKLLHIKTAPSEPTAPTVAQPEPQPVAAPGSTAS